MMGTNLFLTASELFDLTGYKIPSKQKAWLQGQGFIFRVAADGRPRVDRSHYLKLMGGAAEVAQYPKTRPDFTSLRKLT
jgi:hypothetical protein